ncbi:MAG: GNAT family N-acetyltransferase [Planctomycetota bacterium]
MACSPSKNPAPPKSSGFAAWCTQGGQPEPELKYAFRRAFWGQGFATEAGRALIEWGFDTARLNSIIATVSPDNQASHAVLRKIGMRERRCVAGDETRIDVYSMQAPRTT